MKEKEEENVEVMLVLKRQQLSSTVARCVWLRSKCVSGNMLLVNYAAIETDRCKQRQKAIVKSLRKKTLQAQMKFHD